MSTEKNDESPHSNAPRQGLVQGIISDTRAAIINFVLPCLLMPMLLSGILLVPTLLVMLNPLAGIPCLIALVMLVVIISNTKSDKNLAPVATFAGIVLLYIVMSVLLWRALPMNNTTPAWKPGDPVERPEN